MISVLFVNKKSVYKTMTDYAGLALDCWDEERDAMKWPGGNPLIAHPPCRLFSALKHLSRAPATEKNFAFQSVKWVQEHGGVLEHPAMSLLWKEANLPKPGNSDQYGFSIAINQSWFGYPARKSTWLYVCGSRALPIIPFSLNEPAFTLAHSNAGKKELSKSQRSATTPALAKFLVEIAFTCKPSIARIRSA